MSASIFPGSRAAPAAASLPAPYVSVVICTLDESQAIGGVIDELVEALGEITHEIIVVDDSADERTAHAVRGRMRDLPQVRLIHRRQAGGLASAAITGWDAAHGVTLAIMDGDGQHDPLLIGRMVARLVRTQVDVVVASRYLNGGGSGLGGLRHLVSRAGTGLCAAVLGLRLADPLSGCFVMRRDWYEAVRPRLSGLGFKILIDIVASGGRPKLGQVATQLRARAGGQSKLDFRVAFDLLALLTEKRTRGLLPARMSQFLFVGLTGLAVHLAVLGLSQTLAAPFWAGQSLAILTAMSWNFVLNNGLTFRDRRLRGAAAWRGLLSFYVACLSGAALSEGLGAGLSAIGAHWILAGVVGALAGAFWNYRAVQRLTWREGARRVARAGAALGRAITGNGR